MTVERLNSTGTRLSAIGDSPVPIKVPLRTPLAPSVLRLVVTLPESVPSTPMPGGPTVGSGNDTVALNAGPVATTDSGPPAAPVALPVSGTLTGTASADAGALAALSVRA